jgi:hypothetical protein
MSGLIMKYFVLKPRGTDKYAVASRNAMMAYADSIYPFDRELAVELINWVNVEEIKADEK